MRSLVPGWAGLVLLLLALEVVAGFMYAALSGNPSPRAERHMLSGFVMLFCAWPAVFFGFIEPGLRRTQDEHDT
jgi:hypothetical protein